MKWVERRFKFPDNCTSIGWNTAYTSTARLAIKDARLTRFTTTNATNQTHWKAHTVNQPITHNHSGQTHGAEMVRRKILVVEELVDIPVLLVFNRRCGRFNATSRITRTSPGASYRTERRNDVNGTDKATESRITVSTCWVATSPVEESNTVRQWGKSVHVVQVENANGRWTHTPVVWMGNRQMEDQTTPCVRYSLTP